jgi:uncharacterized protein YutD
MMNQACAQCNKHLTDDDRVTRIIDEYLYLFCCYECRFRWVIRHFTLDAELEQAVSLFSKQHNGASAPLFCWHWVCNIKAAW